MEEIEIKNGDVFDIGQTVNGISKFLTLNGCWYYYEDTMSREYEYNHKDLTDSVLNKSELEVITFLGNIFTLQKENKELKEEVYYWKSKSNDYKNLATNNNDGWSNCKDNLHAESLENKELKEENKRLEALLIVESANKEYYRKHSIKLKEKVKELENPKPMICPECQEIECDEDCSNPRNN
jgi:hypothetical protein